MASKFISFLPAPGASISQYDRTKPHTAQPPTVPRTFLDAMSIRETVFVTEQHVPLSNELDTDDPRSYHWVVYASVGQRTGLAPDPPAAEPDTRRRQEREQSNPTARQLAVGTVRLVPPPHPPHPTPGSEHSIDNSEDVGKVPPVPDAENAGPRSQHNPHNEPYVKIGRLAVLPQFRRLGLAQLLMEECQKWVAAHPVQLAPRVDPAQREKRRLETGVVEEMVEGEWRGLVLVHAQRYLEGWYRKQGFVVDEGMGVWVEEGLEHVGMWKRLGVASMRR